MIRRSVSLPTSLVLLLAGILSIGSGPAQAAWTVLAGETRHRGTGAVLGSQTGIARPAGTNPAGLTIGSPSQTREEDPAAANLAAGTPDHEDGSSRSSDRSSFTAQASINPSATTAPERLRISEIQGSGTTAAITGQVMVEAIVTSLLEDNDVPHGFFLQEEDTDSDGDPATSEGIFVRCSTACPEGLAVGYRVTVVGIAGDFDGASRIDATGGHVTVGSSGHDLPAATRLSLPASGSTRAEATFEDVEGMIVTFDGKLVVTEHYGLARYGQLVLAEGSMPYQFTHRHPPSATGYAAFLADLATKRIILDDNSSSQNEAIFPSEGTDEAYPYPADGLSNDNRFRAGDSIEGVTGVMHWAFGAWRIRPVPETFDYIFNADNPRPARPEEVGGTLRVASFNVLNYFTTIDEGAPKCGPGGDLSCRGADSMSELDRQRDKIVAALIAMDADVLGLLEIENNPSESLVDLVGGLNATEGSDTYTYIDTGTIGNDAIKVGLVYRPAVVRPVGPHAIIDSSVDVTFLDTKNRPGLIQTFEEVATGERVTVAINHLKSKGSDCDELGDPDLHDGQGNCNGTRTSAAAALARYLATDPTGAGDPDILIIGDLNAYAQEDPITALGGAGYTDLIRHFVGNDAYSFLFDGRRGYLDHALANPSLLRQVTGVTVWHINTDEPPLFDYNDGIQDPGESAFERESTALTIYEANAFRSSDHDPVIIGLYLQDDLGGPAPTDDPPVAATPFTDLDQASESHRDNISRIYGLGLTAGSSDTTYSPGRPVSRQQAASFLARLYRAMRGDDPPVVETPFTDLDQASESHRDNIGRIYGLGITSGTTDTTFSPDACVPRGRMATFLARLYTAVTGMSPSLVETPFTDLEGATPEVVGDIGRIYGLGITSGTTDTTFSPGTCTTRQQMASFLVRAYQMRPRTLPPLLENPET